MPRRQGPDGCQVGRTPQGATVVRSLAGTMRLVLAPARLSELVLALPGWRYSAGSKTVAVLEGRTLQRSKMKGTLAAAAKGSTT